MLDALDAKAVHRWSVATVERLGEHRDEIDALNVFPVPDGDTGSNLLATMRAAADTAGGTPGGARAVLAAMASGAALGAVGNSGFIVSQLLRGLAEAATGDTLDEAGFALGLRLGADLACKAVVEPFEGTVLTVARAAADAADERRLAGATLDEIVRAALDAAGEALARTPHQLPELARHGVVDAGGRGLVVLLAALAAVVADDGRDAPAIADLPPAVPARAAELSLPVEPAPSAAYGYEVQYLLDPASGVGGPGIDGLRERLDAVGDSVVVVPVTATDHPTGTCKVHVHTDDIGAAVEAGFAYGRVHGVEVVSLTDQVRRRGSTEDRSAVVAVAPGAGLLHLFETEGVHALETAGPVTADEVLRALRAAGTSEVVVLPNTNLAASAADDAARRARADGLRVAVVPTRSPVQGLAAIAVHDAARAFDDDVVAMAEAAAATRVAEITIATEHALTAVGECDPGDVLGLIDGEVVEIGRGMLAVAFGLADRLLGVGAELMTVVLGDGVPLRSGELVEAHIRGRAPLTDVAVYAGGQPDHPMIIGAE